MASRDIHAVEADELAQLARTRVTRGVAGLLTAAFLTLSYGVPLLSWLRRSSTKTDRSVIVVKEDLRRAIGSLLHGPPSPFHRIVTCNNHLLLAIHHSEEWVNECLFIKLPRVSVVSEAVVTTPDPLLGWTFVGSRDQFQSGLGHFQLRFNSLGLRGGEPIADPVALMILGNSITMGQEVPEDRTFAGLLGAVNAGFDGYNTFQQRDKYERDLQQLRPQRLGLVVSPHDIASEEMTRANIRRTLAVSQNLDEPAIQMPSWASWVYAHTMSLFGAETEEDPQRIERWIYQRVTQSIPDAEWDDWTRALRDLKRLAGEGAFFLIYMPPRVEVRDYRRQPRNFPLGVRLRRFCMVNELPFIDLLEPLAKYDPDEIYLDRVHFNDKGHAIIAAQIATFIGGYAQDRQ